MFSALLYLKLASLGNWLRQRLGRLRRPKYLMGGIVGGAYMWFFFFRRLFTGNAGLAGKSTLVLPTELQIVLPGLAAIVLLLMAGLFGWLLRDAQPGLGFTEAEVAFLFPAPVTRRGLIHYKILSSQAGVLFTTLFFSLFSSRWSFLGGNAAIHVAGWWVILATLNLHFMAAGLTLTRLADTSASDAPLTGLALRARLERLRKRFTGQRRLIVILVLAVLCGIWFGSQSLDSLHAEDFSGLAAFARSVTPALTHGPLAWLLFPAKLVVGPFLARSTGAFFLALGPALLLLGAHYWWILSIESPFEEASLTQAEQRGAKIAAWRAGGRAAFNPPTKGRRDPFRLATGGGRPELAFWWKNLLSTQSYYNLRVLGGLAAIILAGSTWLEHHPEFAGVRPAIAIMAAGFAGYTLLIGPSLARQDLRGDLRQLDILKTYPLRGWQVVLGELLTPVSILTGLVWLALLTCALVLGPNEAWSLTLGMRATIFGCAAMLTPALCALQLLVPNAATLVFPSWAQGPRGRAGGGGGGIDVMGQRLIFVFGQMVVVLLALLPIVIVVIGLVVGLGWAIGWQAAVVVAAGAALLMLLGELWLGLAWVGGRFERLDVSAEQLT